MTRDLFQYTQNDRTGNSVKMEDMPAFTMVGDKLTPVGGRMFFNGEFNAYSVEDVLPRIRAVMELFSVGALHIAPMQSDSLFQHWARAGGAKALSLATALLSTEDMQPVQVPVVRVRDQTTKVTLAVGVESNNGLLSEVEYTREDGHVASFLNFWNKELDINLCAYDRMLVGMLRKAAPEEGSDVCWAIPHGEMFRKANSELKSRRYPSGTALLSHKHVATLLKEDEHSMQNNRQAWLDPITKLDLLLQGIVGSYGGVHVYTDAMRPKEYRVLNDDDKFIVSQPVLLGKLFRRDFTGTNIDDKQNVISRYQTYSAYVFNDAVVRVG